VTKEPSWNARPEPTVFKDRERAPPRKAPPSLSSTFAVKSVRTGVISNTIKFRAKEPEPTKDELRAILTQAVLNTK
jgi:hypothetical protein